MGAQAVFQTVRIEPTTCPNCHVPFGVLAEMMASRREDGKSFYCPSGHSMSFRETEMDRLRKRVEWSEAEAKRQRESREAAERRHSVTKGQLTRVRKRIQKGVCPECNRHFTNVERHMATKHTAEAAVTA